MKNGFIGFWGIFIAYFIFVHPCIIYYNTYHTSNNTGNGKLALFYLGLSFFLWAIVLGSTLWLILKNGILAKKNLAHIARHGRRVQAKIIDSHLLKEHKNFISRRITLEMDNFSGQVISHIMTVNDVRPEENRFETGKKINLIVDSEFKKNPYLLLEGSTSKVNYALLFIWLAFTGGAAAYYRYSYSAESGGSGWRFLELSHPLLVIPACFILFTGILYLIFRVFITGNNSGRELLELKFRGEKTTAEIIMVNQTGTYINEQPQVEYTLKFTDKDGKTIHTVKKEIISLLEIGKVQALKYREIMYLPARPEKFVFYDQINN